MNKSKVVLVDGGCDVTLPHYQLKFRPSPQGINRLKITGNKLVVLNEADEITFYPYESGVSVTVEATTDSDEQGDTYVIHLTRFYFQQEDLGYDAVVNHFMTIKNKPRGSK